MLDIVFSASALGALKVGIPLRERAVRQAVALESALSVGDISEGVPGPGREAALRAFLAPAEGAQRSAQLAQKLVEKTRSALNTVLDCARRGEPLRIWYSHNPDELCGLCWLMDRLRPFSDPDLTTVGLPPYQQRKDGTVVVYNGWGEVVSESWEALSSFGERPSPALRLAWATKWEALQRENAPLRAVINHRLISVEEDFYDPFLRWELARMPTEFSQALLLGHTLGKYQLGISDALLAGRVEEWVRNGELEVLSPPAAGEILYRRTLRKKA